MTPLDYRSPIDSDAPRRFARWLNGLRNQSGAYVIRSRSTHEILYVGESHTGNLARTIKRHFWQWNDRSERAHYQASPHHVEIAVRITPPPTAKAAQDNLILRLTPKHNAVVPF